MIMTLYKTLDIDFSANISGMYLVTRHMFFELILSANQKTYAENDMQTDRKSLSGENQLKIEFSLLKADHPRKK